MSSFKKASLASMLASLMRRGGIMSGPLPRPSGIFDRTWHNCERVKGARGGLFLASDLNCDKHCRADSGECCCQ
eukprot:7406372-Pyramimonas_sp.AAC.1